MEKEKIKERLKDATFYRGFIEVDDKAYFYKEVQHSGIEMVVKKICDLVGINCPNYIQVKVNDTDYYVSEGISKFYSAYDLGIDTYKDNIDDLLIEFHDNYKFYDINIVRMFLYRVYFLDILINNIDRTNGNWRVSEKDIFSCYILDNEDSFWTKDNNKPFLTTLSNNGDSKEDLENFLNLHPEYRFVFEEMYYRLTPKVVASIFKSVEDEFGVTIEEKEEKVLQYLDNYNKIGNIIKKDGFSLRLFEE